MNDPNTPPGERPYTFVKCVNCGKSFSNPADKTGWSWMLCEPCFAPDISDESAWEGDDVQ